MPQFSTVRLGRVARVRSGDTISKAGMADDGVPVFGANGQMGYVPQPNFPQGALCVGRVGSCGAVNHHKYPVFISDNALVVRPARDSVSASFLEYVFRATNFAPLVNQGAMPLLTGGDLADLRVPLPESHIQTAIADFLDRKTAAINAAIANKQTLIEDLQKYWEAVIMEAVAPREGWRPVRLKHLVRALPKSTLQAGAATEEGTVPFFVSGARVKRAAEALVTNGSAVVLATGGNATVHRAQGTFAYSTDCWALESKDSTAYLYFLLAFLKPVIAEVGFQGAGIKHLDKDWLLSLRVVLPSLGEQQAIAEELIRRENALQASIAKTEDAIAMLRRYKTSLIQEAVTGVTQCC